MSYALKCTLNAPHNQESSSFARILDHSQKSLVITQSQDPSWILR